MKSKVTLAVGSVIGILVVVYGTALLLRLVFEAYLFEGGLTNLNYGLMALLCAAPFVVIAVVERNTDENKRALIISALLFSTLFILVHLVLVFSGEVIDASRVMTIFPVSALVLAVVLFFTAGKEKSA